MGRPRKDENDKADPNQRLVCEICSLEYTRSNKSKHLKSKYHMMVENLTTAKENKRKNIRNMLKDKQNGGRQYLKEKRSRERIIDSGDSSESDTESESSDENINEVKNNKPVTNFLKLNIPDEYFDYIKENNFTVHIFDDKIDQVEQLFNDPNVNYDEKIKLIDSIAKNVKNNNRNSILDKLRDKETLKKFTKI